jgi:uncharacterized protein (TIGR02246 family)
MAGDMDRETKDRIALRDLVVQYARAADERDAPRFADVFTDDGVLVTPTGEIRGRAELLTVPVQLGRFESTQHRVGDHIVDMTGPDENRATGQVECVAEHKSSSGGRSRVYVMYIRYHDEYVLGSSGWRIAHRRLELLRDEHR